MMHGKLYLIDGHALCYRSFYAIRELVNSRGQATNAIYGFVNTLRKILKDYQPEFSAVCFDSPGKTYRAEKYAEYKIQRPKMPDDLIAQIPIIKDIMKAYQIETFEVSGFEADDIIATIVEGAMNKEMEVVIVSDDKDMFQLAHRNIKFLSLRKDCVLSQDDIKLKLGFDPVYMADFLGLAGDQADNIPGVAGIGEVTARNLINQFGAIESIYQNIDDVKPARVQQKLRDQHDEAVLSKELALLSKDVPLDFDLARLGVKSPDQGRLFHFFKDLEFKRFAREYADSQEAPADAVLLEVSSAMQYEDLCAGITSLGRLSFLFYSDTEASSQKDMFLDTNHACQRVMIFCGERRVAVIKAEDFHYIKPLWQDKSLLKITHNIKEAIKVLKNEGIEMDGVIFDVNLAGYLLIPGNPSFSIVDLAWHYLKHSMADDKVIDHQVIALDELYFVMSAELSDRKLDSLFNTIEIPLTCVLARMEMQGVALDISLLQTLSEKCEQEIKKLMVQLFALVGREFNVNSPKQLSQILFEELNLPVIKKTKTGFSTDEEVLRKLAKEHDAPALILEYRQFVKLKSTYIDALPKLLSPQTGRVHASFDQTTAGTGRLSSRQPNLQNIPIRTEFGRQIRKAFVPSNPDDCLLAADYSQIELRILAHLSRDENLIQAFEQGQDIHRYTASLIFEVKESEVTAHMRDVAKRVNFGIIYGMSSFGLAKDLDITNIEAQEFIDRYFLRYPKVQDFMQNAIAQCESQGYVLTLLNRRRYIPEINSRNGAVRQFAQRQAINTPVQGSAADLIKLAMINVQKEMDRKNVKSKMIITVHDELVFEVTKDEESLMCEMVRRLMEHAFELVVPMVVSLKIGKNWLEMKEVK